MDWMDWVHLVTRFTILHQDDGLPSAGSTSRMVLLASSMAIITIAYVSLMKSKLLFIFSVVFSLAFISYVISVSKVHESYKYGHEYISRYGTAEQINSMNRCLASAKRGEIELPEAFSTLLYNCEEKNTQKQIQKKNQTDLDSINIQ